MAQQNQFLASPLDTVTDRIQQERFELPPLPKEEVAAPPAAAPAEPQAAATKQAKKGSSSDDYTPPAEFRPVFESAARKYNVPVNVLMALGHQESRFNPTAIGVPTQWGRAKGMMQYIDDTANRLGINPFEPTEAIDAAAKQIRQRLDKGYSMEDAVKAHFAGDDRRLWKDKTAAYGSEVLQKAAKIADALYPFDQSPEEVARLDRQRTEIEAQEVERDRLQQTAAGQGLPMPQDQKAIDERGFFDRAGNALSSGYDGMLQSLNTARFAVAGGDSTELARSLSDKFQREASRPKTTGEKEIDTAFKAVTDAKGAWDTVKAGAKAIGTAVSNPKDLAVGIVEQAPNMLPTVAAGVGGAGAGGAAGAGVGSLFGGVGALPGAATGAIWGGRAGMVAGTTATELGAEVEQMILERLEAKKVAPTEQNIKALLDNQAFQTEARNRGLKKGLTVALVDQIFLGLGGKVATAPARKLATKELADQGVDVSTRAARKAALASPAGRAALDAAKPSLGARAAAGGAAIGLDATGEVVGEAASQKVARGEVDAGDALREGVYGLGQSIVEPAIGAAMQTAKRAVTDNSPGAQLGRELDRAVSGAQFSQESINREAVAALDPNRYQQQAAPTQTVTQPAPSQADGPLTRAVENAAEQPARVTVTAPEGEISGFVLDVTQDDQGNSVTRVLGDDGQTYNFTSADAVEIKPESGPLTKAIEKVAAKQPAVTAGPAIWRNADYDVPVEVKGIEPQPGSDGRTYARVTRDGAESFVPADELFPAAQTGATANDDLGIRDVGQQGNQAAAQAGANQQGAGAGDQAGNAGVRGDARAFEPGARAGVLGADATADAQPALSQQPETAADVAGALGKMARREHPATVDPRVDRILAAETYLQNIAANDSARAAQIAADFRANPEKFGEVAGVSPEIVGRYASIIERRLGTYGKQPATAKQATTAPDSIEAMTEPELRAQLKAVAGQPQAAEEVPNLAPAAEQPKLPATKEDVQKRVERISQGLRKKRGASRGDDGYTVAMAEQDLADIDAMRQQDGADTEALNDLAKQIDYHVGMMRKEEESSAPATDEATPAEWRKDMFQALSDADRDAPMYAKLSAAVRGRAPASPSDRATMLQQARDLPRKEQAESKPTEPTEPTPPTGGGKPSDYGANNKLVSRERAAELRDRLKKKLSGTQLNSGIDPELLAIGTELAVFHIEAGARKFAQFAKAIAEDLDMPVSSLRPDLRSWYNGARDMTEDMGGDVAGMDSAEVVRKRSGRMSVDDLRAEITAGPVGQVIARLIDNGRIVLHANAETLPQAARGKRGVQAVTLANGQIHLVANRLTKDNARPVLLHEMFHMGGEALVGSKEWGNLMGRLGSLHRQAELSTGKAREFFDRARDRVAAARAQGAVSTGMTVEEFGAYAIEEWEQKRDSLPAVIRKWVEDFIGHIKAYVLQRYGKQLGDVTPAQLAAMAKLVIMNTAVMAERGQLDGVSGKFSVADDSKELAEAQDALDAPKVKDDYIGRVVGDISLGARLLVHPRTVAAVHKEFTPVYRTAISQMETRDKLIAEFGADVKAYDTLDQQGKENVNKVLELGRLTSAVYSAKVLRDGVVNPGEKQTVVMVAGKPMMAKEPIHALLTGVGEVVKLNEQEIKAYQNLRRMFDAALDKMRDQTLEEMGFPEFVGMGNAAAKIVATIDKTTTPEKAERIQNIARFVAEIEQAKRAGYVPFARYGDYVVTVKEKIADVSFVEDDKDHYIAKDLPDSFAPELVEMGAERNKEGWRILKSQKRDVERLTEKTIYSTKVETGLTDLLDEKRAGKVDDIGAVKDAIELARKEWVDGHLNRRIVAFKTREKKTDQPVKLSDVDALAEVANIDNGTWDAIRDKLSDAIKAKGFRRHFFHSDNVPGYTGDFERSIADYVIGMSGYLSRRQHMKKWDNAVSGVEEKPKLFEYASKYRDYVNNPQEELAMVRQIGFFSYIAGVMASAFANLTQVPIMTVPTLAQVAPMPLVVREITSAYKDAAKMISAQLEMFDPDKAPADVRDILKEAWAEGNFVPLESFDLMMTARQRNVGARKGVKAFNKATQLISLSFTFAERMNRLVTFIAAARLAQKHAVKENAKKVLAGDALARAEVLRSWSPKSFAEWAVDESQYRMGKANRPSVMRGVGSAIMQFKGFMLQTFEAWYRMAALHGRPGKYAAAASVLALYAFAGIWGLPGADDLRALLESIYKTITDKDLDLKTELRAWIARTSGSNALAQMVSKGASYPLGVDLTRVGMGSVVPDSPLAAAGIPFDMLIGRPKRAFEKATAGDELGAAGELTPNFIKHWLVAGSWALEGVRDKRGTLILTPDDLNAGDLAMKALGFQPSIITDVRDYEYAQRRQETAVDGLKRSYANRLAKALTQLETASPDDAKEIEEQVADIYAEIDEHNATAAPEDIIKIDNRTLRTKMMREREGVKATWGRERKAGRMAAEELRGVFGLQPGQEDDE